MFSATVHATFRTRLLDEEFSLQGKLYKPQVHEQQHNLDDRIKWDAQRYQDTISSVSVLKHDSKIEPFKQT